MSVLVLASLPPRVPPEQASPQELGQFLPQAAELRQVVALVPQVLVQAAPEVELVRPAPGLVLRRRGLRLRS